jgi:tetratricopeptide (TPR) repeat protein
VLVVCAGAPGCGKGDKSLSEVKQAFAEGDYNETVALCKYAIRRQADSPETYYYYGAALVSLDRDYEGYRMLEQAIAGDMALAAKAARYLVDNTSAERVRRDRAQAARRLQKAAEYDPSLDLGSYRFLVADAYFDAKNFQRAAEMYSSALEAYPDTSIAETVYLNLAGCYTEQGWNARARETYEEMLARFPRGAYKSEVGWRLANLMYNDAEKENQLGNYEDAVKTLESVIAKTTNGGLLQKSNFLLGETYEAMGDLPAAYRAYKRVIEVDRGASGSIVERAREKIAALQEAGLF